MLFFFYNYTTNSIPNLIFAETKVAIFILGKPKFYPKMIQIYHNQRCGKSRNCLLFLEESNKEFEIINYLNTPPTVAELTLLLKKLKFSPIELVRQKEKIWIENYKGKTLSDDQIIQAMVENPILIERPIVVRDDQAIIGRDLSLVNPFI